MRSKAVNCGEPELLEREGWVVAIRVDVGF